LLGEKDVGEMVNQLLRNDVDFLEELEELL
jgi:hypothetical protein